MIRLLALVALVVVTLLGVALGSMATVSTAVSTSTTAAVAAVAQQQSRERCQPGAPADVLIEGQGAELVAKVAHAAGWRGEDLRIAIAVAGAESSFNPSAANDYQAGHVGLWQISGLHTDLMAKYGDRLDPAANARMAFELWDRRKQWHPTWEAYTNGAYEQYLDDADAALRSLSIETAAQPAVQRAVVQCTPTPGMAPGSTPVPADIAPSGWTLPSSGAYTSRYGMRTNPVSGIYKLHGGIDLAGGCGTPILAAASGVVSQAGPTQSYGTLITIQHTDGVSTLYAHSRLSDHRVRVGDVVVAGQQITSEGTEGDSTGCHLHFEVRVDNQRTDPAPFLAARGVTLPPLR